MKRISVHLFSTYLALYKDLLMWGQADAYEVERDLSRITSLVETRGERSIFLDFPACAKSLDKALSRGKLDLKKFAILGRDPYDGLPAFMHSRWKRVFTSDGALLKDPDVSAVIALRQVLLLYKKVQIPCSAERICNEVRDFFKTDASLRSPDNDWGNLVFDRIVSFEDVIVNGEGLPGIEPGVTTSRSLSRLSQRVCDMVVRGLDTFTPDAVVGNHGPGAVADLQSGLDKYVFPTWNRHLSKVFPRDLHASANIRVFDYEWWNAEGNVESLRTVPAKLIPVAKTQEKPRLIASEPAAQQFIQGGIRKELRKWIDGSVLRNCLDITDQTKSAELAVRASMDSSLATVDLSNASDRLSMWTVERVFRKAPALLEALSASRSFMLTDPKYTQISTMLRKYAPQGNATVFPLQSIVYSCLAIAAVIWSTPRLGSSKDESLLRSISKASKLVRVYGDDIIVPTHCLPALSSLLELCQLKVNGGKSHYSGLFAESCGVDAFKGTDVTPVYLASVDDEIQRSDVQSAVDVSNACYRAGLINLGNLVAGRIEQSILDRLVITRTSGPSTLLFTYSSGIRANLRRWNKNLQRREYETLTVVDKPIRQQRDDWSSLLQYCIEGPKPDFLGNVPNWASGWNRRGRTKLVRQWVPMPAEVDGIDG